MRLGSPAVAWGAADSGRWLDQLDTTLAAFSVAPAGLLSGRCGAVAGVPTGLWGGAQWRSAATNDQTSRSTRPLWTWPALRSRPS